MTAPARLLGALAACALSLLAAPAVAQPAPSPSAAPDPRPVVAPPPVPETERVSGLVGAALAARHPTLPVGQRPPSVPFAVPTPVVAGWRDDRFFLSDPSHDWFISPGARLQVDFHAFVPLDAADERAGGTASAPMTLPSTLRTGFQLRRARIEMAGGVFRRITFNLGAELTDNGPQTAADMYINLGLLPLFNIQVGQFDAPFTMENRTSDRYLDLIERSITVQGLGVPTGKEIGLMLWGEDRRQHAYWSVGVFNGGGPNRFTAGNQIEGMARVVFHPFSVASSYRLGQRFQIGASGRVASRSVGAQSPYPAMTTPGGYTLFNPALGPDVTLVPSGIQWAVGGEFVIPLDRLDLRGEFVYVHNQTGEVAAPADGALGRDPVRRGHLEGFGVYGQIGFWVVGLPGGHVRRSEDELPRGYVRPGYQDPPSIDLRRAQPLSLPFGLQVLVRFETVQFAYRGNSVDTGGQPDSAASGEYRVWIGELGLNLWLTRHARLLIGYRQYLFPGQTGGTTPDSNRMRGPPSDLTTYGEFSTRLALSL